jgi:site-specific DNA recombinase
MTAARRTLRPVPDSPGRVVLYTRVSALMDRGGEAFHSPDIQLAAMRRVTAGMREVAVIEDLDVTGRNFVRKGIERIRRMAERREIDALAVYDVSRLGRNVRESLTFLAWLAEQGVTILSACEQVDTSTPAGRLMLTNMLAIAEYRSDEIGRGWAAAIARRAEKGTHHGNPIGYTRVDGRLQPDPLLGPVIAKAWRDYAAGVPVAEICRDVAVARGKMLQASNLKTMFRRPSYLGHVVAGGVIVAENAHPALTDQATFDRVQQRLARDRVTPPKHLAVTWALVGLAYCTCGAHLQRNPAKRRGKTEQRLKCGKGPGRAIQGDGRCIGIGMPLLAEVEAEVLRQTAAYVQLLRTDEVSRMEHLRRRDSAVADAEALRKRLSNVQKGISRLARDRATGDLEDAEYQPAVADLRAERDSLQVRIGALGDVEERPTPRQFATAAEALLARWDEMNFHQRNRALRALIERITVRRAAFWREPESDRVTIDWR